jgi:hypothetical protein
MGSSSWSSDPDSSASTFNYFRQNRRIAAEFWLTVGKWNIYLMGQLEKWLSKMTCDVLAIWIKAFGSMELTESGVYASIPGAPVDFCSEL